jgi:hypothetical protein
MVLQEGHLIFLGLGIFRGGFRLIGGKIVYWGGLMVL